MQGAGFARAVEAALLLLVLLVTVACEARATATTAATAAITGSPVPVTARPTPTRPVPTLTPGATLPATASPGQDQGAPVSVELIADTLVITNHTAAPIYHEVLRQELLPLIEWVPCSHPDRCPEARIPPGQSMQYALAQLTEAGTEGLMVFWWHLAPAGEGQYAVSDFGGVEVPLER